MLSIGEMQTLKMLTALQCLTEADPRRPAPGYVCQCMESIMCPMMAIGMGPVEHWIWHKSGKES